METSMWMLCAAGPADTWPLVILAVSVGLIITLITVFRVHAFLALVLAAMAVGWMARPGSLPGADGKTSHWIQAMELTTSELGVTAGKIAVMIGLAAIIGMCLLESGAADKVVRRFLAAFGERRAGFALLVSGYVLSIPIFFDTFFMLLLPIAQALALRTGRDYLLYLMAICCAGVVTHSLVIPHPGPLAMAEALRVDYGVTVWVGLVVGTVPVLASWQVAKWLNARCSIPVRETAAGSLADLRGWAERPESELPAFGASILPVILPIVLISTASTFKALPPAFLADHALLNAWVQFLGHRNIALLLGTAIAVGVLVRQRRLGWRALEALMGPPLGVAAIVILITSAGGAFGLMLKNAGVGHAVEALVAGKAVNLVLLAWLVAAVIRVAQGSATVAMLSASAMVYPMTVTASGDVALPYHPVYIFMAIGFGAMICSWMNDSGFWVVSKLSGLTEQETLRSWTVVATVNSVVGLAMCLLLSMVLPCRPG